ncbi:PREDICTED: double-strand-break repair protein rad21-like protein 1 [Nanorana parkeri]|uniref:double-strand-break repair protein rad21-like protein 1 n=1 Tax=Nanorana parkeri TaxID=125878 RepID=UPI0008548F0C|nr:PREDICTED: double-strand-break repair protein rad21-like protein 1 [Nanorana parkeri]
MTALEDNGFLGASRFILLKSLASFFLNTFLATLLPICNKTFDGSLVDVCEFLKKMFYTHVLLDKHGILAKIWIAAHWHKKLTKSNIFECNLEMAIKNIVSAKMVMSLRISGHLLLGVVRVYNRKTKYLLTDCSDSLLKMKLAFRPDSSEMLDLSDTNQEAQYKSITRQEEFYDFNNQLPDLNNIEAVDHFTLNQSRVEDITMKEDYNRQCIQESIGNLDPLREEFNNESSFEVSTNSVLPESSFVGLNEDAENLFNHDLFGDEDTAANVFAYSTLFAEYNPLDMDASKEVTLLASPLAQEQYLEGELLAEIEKRKRTRKKRNLTVDDSKQISSTFFRQQLEDTLDTLTTMDIAPPTHCMMEWKKTGGVQWLLSEPAQPVINTDLQMLFTQNQRSETGKSNRSATTKKKAQEMPSEPEVETQQQDQEEQDLPQLEATAVTDISSTFSEEPSGMHELPGFDQQVAHESSLVQEEPTESIQESDEHQWAKRTQKMLNCLKEINQSGVNSFNFNTICENDKKKEAATKFYSLLVLKNKNAIRMVQNSPYGNIIVMPGPQFHTL